tara:strand:- start:1095 stop:1523 length:429 start_codon:yes stop_codon:yes gene_type:complete
MLEKLKILLYLVGAYIGVEVEAFMILIGFMCIDSVLGAIKAMRFGDRFSFNKMLWGFILKLCFLVVPLVLALLGKSLGYDFTMVVNITISILTVAEAYSIIGNIYSAKNKVKVDKVDAISLLLISIRKMIKNILDTLLGKIK